MAQIMGMKDAKEPMDFITMLVKLQEDCEVADLRMSDCSIEPENLKPWRRTQRIRWVACFFVTELS